MSHAAATRALWYVGAGQAEIRDERLEPLAAGAVRSTVTALTGEFEALTGNKLSFTFDTAGGLRDKLVAGAPADMIIAPPATLDVLAEKGLLQAGSESGGGRSGRQCSALPASG